MQFFLFILGLLNFEILRETIGMWKSEFDQWYIIYTKMGKPVVLFDNILIVQIINELMEFNNATTRRAHINV